MKNWKNYSMCERSFLGLWAIGVRIWMLKRLGSIVTRITSKMDGIFVVSGKLSVELRTLLVQWSIVYMIYVVVAVAMPTQHHMSCLTWAAGRGHTEIVRQLIQFNAKVTTADKVSDWMSFIFIIACLHRHHHHHRHLILLFTTAVLLLAVSQLFVFFDHFYVVWIYCLKLLTVIVNKQKYFYNKKTCVAHTVTEFLQS